MRWLDPNPGGPYLVQACDAGGNCNFIPPSLITPVPGTWRQYQAESGLDHVTIQLHDFERNLHSAVVYAPEPGASTALVAGLLTLLLLRRARALFGR